MIENRELSAIETCILIQEEEQRKLNQFIAESYVGVVPSVYTPMVRDTLGKISEVSVNTCKIYCIEPSCDSKKISEDFWNGFNTELI